MADVHMLPLDVLPPYHTAMTKRRIHYGMRKTRVLHMKILLQWLNQFHVTLMYLLHYFQHRHCHVMRDRIFSLLGSCKMKWAFK
jgi:hypothetical protein